MLLGLSALYLSNLAWEVVCPLMWTTVCPVHDINAHFILALGIIAGSLVFYVYVIGPGLSTLYLRKFGMGSCMSTDVDPGISNA